MAIIEYFTNFVVNGYKYLMKTLGVVLGAGLYVLLVVHVHAYFNVMAKVLKKRLGVPFGLLWIAIGLCLLYNIIFNHLLAMFVKPGCPKDVMRVEALRKESKQREHRKAAKVRLDSGAGTDSQAPEEDDRFEGLQKDVKRLVKYRTKTMGQLQGFWTKRCQPCDEIKPARTHHCTICDACVFHMDHHCRKCNSPPIH
jgi:hypothetical protein